VLFKDEIKIEKLGKTDHILRVFVLEGHKAKRAVQLLNYVHGLGRLNVIQDAHRFDAPEKSLRGRDGFGFTLRSG
jgi:hypothetical protein